MSQVGLSRPATGTGPMLPAIQHPLSRMASPEKLDVRGVSRSGDRPLSQASKSGRPLANETSYISPRKIYSSAGRESKMRGRQSFEQPPIYESIPEGVEVVLGDSTKARLPIFGK